MLAITKPSSSDLSSINILPCRINHNGPAKVTKRHWQPRVEANGTQTAHFRGRRLRGRVVRLPEKYEGIVLRSSDKTLVEPAAIVEEEDEDEPELPDVVKVVEHVASFESMTVWGHDQLPASDDSFAKGIEEWIAFAEAIHGKD